MTTQTKTYIDPSDIVAVRVECKKCGCTVSIPISRTMSFSGLDQCKNCNSQMFRVAMTTIEPEMKSLADAIQAASDRVKSWQEVAMTMGGKGFAVSLEIKAESKP